MTTLVTCLYDIRKKEGSSCQNISTLQDYLGLSRHMLQVDLPMVVFTDDEAIVDHVSQTRAGYGLLEKTRVVVLPFEQTYFYKDLGVLRQRMDEFQIVNWNKEKDTPLYVLLNNNKFDFLQRAMDMDPFHTDFFLWMDMGIQHCTKATKDDWEEVSQLWPSFLDRDHIHQLRIHTVVKPEDMAWKEYFRMIYHHVAGGLFGGEKTRMREYIRLFQQQWDTILYQEGWWQLDEAVMTILAETYPEKFRFFYGDYDGLLSNFIVVKKSFPLVFQTAQRHLDAGRHDLAARVLERLGWEYLVGTEYMETYFNMLICNDFYHRGGNMSPALAHLLQGNDIWGMVRPQIRNLQHLTDPRVASFLVRWTRHDPDNRWAWERWQKTEGGSWVGLDRVSRMALSQNHYLGIDLPVDKNDPTTLLWQFRTQFGMSPEVARPLHNLLETKGSVVYFLYNTASLLERDFTEEEHRQHDQQLARVCGFLRRNFPHLTFQVIALFANRLWSLPEKPPELLVFCLNTPYVFRKKTHFHLFLQSASEWFRLLVSG